MKRLFALCLALALMLSLSACGGKKTLDFKSVKVIDTGAIISLGDKKEDIDKILGNPEVNVPGNDIPENEPLSEYISCMYNDPKINLIYKDNVLMSIFLHKDNSHYFEIKGSPLDMSKDNLEKTYDRLKSTTLYKFMNDSGKNSDRDDAKYITKIDLIAGKNKDEHLAEAPNSYSVSTIEFQDALNESYPLSAI